MLSFHFFIMLFVNNSFPSQQLFDKINKNYQTLRKKNAFLAYFQKEAMFKDNYQEFDDSS